MDIDAATTQLREREPLFHREPADADRAHFEAMTAPDFWEVGGSGARYERAAVIDVLVERKHDAAATLIVEEFQVRAISSDTYLATYVLWQGRRRTRRCTVWSYGREGWQAVYHQGTLA